MQTTDKKEKSSRCYMEPFQWITEDSKTRSILKSTLPRCTESQLLIHLFMALGRPAKSGYVLQIVCERNLTVYDLKRLWLQHHPFALPEHISLLDPNKKVMHDKLSLSTFVPFPEMANVPLPLLVLFHHVKHLKTFVQLFENIEKMHFETCEPCLVVLDTQESSTGTRCSNSFCSRREASVTFDVCQRCLTSKYCNRVCQVIDWECHQKNCKRHALSTY